MTELFYFEIIDGTKIIFRSEYYVDQIIASRRASEILILMGKSAPTKMLSYWVLSVKVVDSSVPDNYALQG